MLELRKWDLKAQHCGILSPLSWGPWEGPQRVSSWTSPLSLHLLTVTHGNTKGLLPKAAHREQNYRCDCPPPFCGRVGREEILWLSRSEGRPEDPSSWRAPALYPGGKNTAQRGQEESSIQASLGHPPITTESHVFVQSYFYMTVHLPQNLSIKAAVTVSACLCFWMLLCYIKLLLVCVTGLSVVILSTGREMPHISTTRLTLSFEISHTSMIL